MVRQWTVVPNVNTWMCSGAIAAFRLRPSSTSGSRMRVLWGEGRSETEKACRHYEAVCAGRFDTQAPAASRLREAAHRFSKTLLVNLRYFNSSASLA